MMWCNMYLHIRPYSVRCYCCLMCFDSIFLMPDFYLYIFYMKKIGVPEPQLPVGCCCVFSRLVCEVWCPDLFIHNCCRQRWLCVPLLTAAWMASLSCLCSHLRPVMMTDGHFTNGAFPPQGPTETNNSVRGLTHPLHLHWNHNVRTVHKSLCTVWIWVSGNPNQNNHKCQKVTYGFVACGF